jgi:2-dehydropantoate 2-reductase
MQRAGVVENSGNIQKLFFGIENYKSKALLSFETLLKEAKIEAVLSDEITKIIWEKYIFISAMAASTSYFDCPIGMVIQNNYQSLLDLIEEVSQLARINNIPVDDRIEALTMKKLRSLPPDATSSLHSDIRNQKKQSELFSLTGYVVEAGARTKVNTPTYRKIYEALK